MRSHSTPRRAVAIRRLTTSLSALIASAVVLIVLGTGLTWSPPVRAQVAGVGQAPADADQPKEKDADQPKEKDADQPKAKAKAKGSTSPDANQPAVPAVPPDTSPAKGPVLFATEPQTPMALWDRIDSLIRGGRPDYAAVYLQRLLKTPLDDATWLAIGNRYGMTSLMRLSQHPATRPYAQPVLQAFGAAMRRELERHPTRENPPPGPELFAREPRTPLELWEAADYLIRTGQPAKAVPYLEKFQRSQPDDATLVAVRERYGPGSFLRLTDDPATQPFAKPLIDALTVASQRYAAQPDRMAQSVAELTLTPAEQDYAVRRLREAGPYAIPYLIEALRRPGLSRRDHDLLVKNMGRLRPSVIPPLAAVLESPEPALAADAATAMGTIGDRSAVLYLTFPAAATTVNPALRSAAQAAIARLTGRPLADQPRTPVQILTEAAWSEHRGRPVFPEETVQVWSWDAAKHVPVPRTVTTVEAQSILGLRFAREALRLDPNNRSAQVAQLSLALEKAVQGIDPDTMPAKDPATFAAATAAGPERLGEVLLTAIADGKSALAAATVLALARVTDPATLVDAGHPVPLVRALSAPWRRVQFAAARALVELAPRRPFPGASLVAPVLARFLMNQPQPRAVVIDSNPNRGGVLTGFLSSLGYHPVQERTGPLGFLAAAEAADVELIVVSYDLFFGDWLLIDTLANLQADARTAGIPLYVSGPYDLRFLRPNLERDFPGIRWLVPPLDPEMLDRELKAQPVALAGLPVTATTTASTPFTEADRVRMARDAAGLLARIAADRRSVLASGLLDIEPALILALVSPETVRPAAAILSGLSDPDAQRALADLVLDPSQPPAFRAQVAALLVQSIRRFKPLLTARQEVEFGETLDQEVDQGVRSGIAAVLDALKPSVPPDPTPTRTTITPARLRIVEMTPARE